MTLDSTPAEKARLHDSDLVATARPKQIAQDKVVEGVSITDLGAFQLQWGLFQDAGFNLMADPSELRLAYNQKKVGRV